MSLHLPKIEFLSKSLRSEFLKLLREDEEFKYAVAGLIGLDEILKRNGKGSACWSDTFLP